MNGNDWLYLPEPERFIHEFDFPGGSRKMAAALF
jgi:hypothetical protein